MRCKYQVRWFYSKGAFLILFWIGSLVFVGTSLINLLPRKEGFYWIDWIYSLVVLLAVSVVPLIGWLADARFGNYKVARFGIFLMFLGTVFNCLLFTITSFVDDSVLLKLSSVFMYVLFSMGGTCCSFSLLQLGLDQMPDASSSSISSCITWLVFSVALGGYLATILDGTISHCVDVSLCSNCKLVWSFVLVLCVSCVLISDFHLSKKWLIIMPRGVAARGIR